MGLDGVELLMEVENSFGIQISEKQSSEIKTVGDLYAIVLDNTRHVTRGPSTCLTRVTFYELRRQLTSRNVDSSSIRPRTTIESSIPRRLRRSLWKQLTNVMGLEFPHLKRPLWVTQLAVCVVLVATIAAFVWSRHAGNFKATIAAMIAWIGATVFAALATLTMATEPAAEFRTYRGLVTKLVATNYAKLAERYSSWNPTEVWIVLQMLIVEHLGVRKEIVTPDANFQYDLGVD